MSNPVVGFSTLGCPDWPLQRVLAFAEAKAVDVLEIRFLNGRTVGLETTAIEVAEAARQLRASTVRAHTLATGVHLAKGPIVSDELLRMLDIAAEWECRQLRVFAGSSQPQASIEDMAAVVRPVMERAASLGLRIGIETHDDLRAGRDAARLAELVDDPAFGIVWDMVHTAAAGETPEDSWAVLGGRALEVQVKDARLGEKVQPVLLGAGDINWKGAIATARRSGFEGPFVLEWEKAWHKDLAEPDVALPYELAALRAALAAG
jgi:sugar phosphate isomerase/epimerase